MKLEIEIVYTRTFPQSIVDVHEYAWVSDLNIFNSFGHGTQMLDGPNCSIWLQKCVLRPPKDLQRQHSLTAGFQTHCQRVFGCRTRGRVWMTDVQHNVNFKHPLPAIYIKIYTNSMTVKRSYCNCQFSKRTHVFEMVLLFSVQEGFAMSTFCRCFLSSIVRAHVRFRSDTPAANQE